MFKFNFSSSEGNVESFTDELSYSSEEKWVDCKEFVPEKSKITEDILNAQYSTISYSNIQLKYISSNDVIKTLHNEVCTEDVSVLKAEQNHSDLIPAVYEGGFKIWECTYDLLNYLNDNNVSFENKKVLDLGCGAGLLGIYTLLKGSTCCFQDYNLDVIQYITTPNVLLNSKDILKKSKFYSGDWQSFLDLLGENLCEDNKFDFIVTSETIYNTDNYCKLHKIIETLLKKDGIVYLSAKSFYFGVGGGISLFQDFLDKHKILLYSCCWKCTDHVKREILKIYFNNINLNPSTI